MKFEKLTLELNDSKDGYIVTACEKDAVEVQIPQKVDGLPVRSIGENAFKDCNELRSVIFPENGIEAFIEDEMFKEIGEYAFSGCIALQSIEIPNGTWCIGYGAFYGCESLKSAQFEWGVFIGPYAFAQCEKLKEVSEMGSVSEGAFSNCISLEKFPVGSAATEISEDAFEHCYALKEIVIPASVKRIESLAFRGCRGLKRVIFEDPNGWFVEFRYAGFDDRALDLTDPLKNAEMLSRQDFDDGIITWYKK